MTDTVIRLNAALEGRYRVEREIRCQLWHIVPHR